MRLFPRRRSSWELIDRKSVAPVLILDYSDDYDDVDILNIYQSDVRGRYIFDVTPEKLNQDVLNALVFSRQQLIQETAKNGWNSFIKEGWEVTTFKKGAKRRVEVLYDARPALVSEGKGHQNGATRPPPFLDVLRSQLY